MERLSGWILKLFDFLVSHQLGFVFLLAMHVINGKFSCLPPQNEASAHGAGRQPELLFRGSRNISQGSAYLISSFGLGSSRLLGVDKIKGKKQCARCSSHRVSLLASGPFCW